MSAWPAVVRDLPDIPPDERRGLDRTLLGQLGDVVQRYWREEMAEVHFVATKDVYVVRILSKTTTVNFEEHVAAMIENNVGKRLIRLFAGPVMFYGYIIFRDYEPVPGTVADSVLRWLDSHGWYLRSVPRSESKPNTS